MPQFAPTVLKDRASPRADHTFKPRDVTNGIATFVESTGVPIGERRLTYSRNRTAQGREKVSIKLAMPVVQNAVVGGVSKPTVVRTAYAELNFSFDGSSTQEERDEVVSFIHDLTDWDHVVTQGVAVLLEGIY
jgi:hypothetical protein